MRLPLPKFSSLRTYLIAGLLVWVPLGITVMVSILLIDLVDRSLVLLPYSLRPETLLGFRIPCLGIILTTIIVFTTGFAIAHFAGKRFVTWTEDFLSRIPLVRSIYSATKQVTHTILTPDSNAFRKVLLIEYPRKGIWSIGFQTKDGAIEEIIEHAKEDLVTVFVPTTPNPTSGFVIMVPEADTKTLDLEIEDALKLVMSLGVVTPEVTQQKVQEKIEKTNKFH